MKIVTFLKLYFGLIGFVTLCPHVFCENELATLPPSCDSKIYCESELLHDVQMAKLYKDSKSFVDMRLKYPESVILSNYKLFKNGFTSKGLAVPKAELQEFVNRHMAEGDELKVWVPPDFRPNTALALRVMDPQYSQWTFGLNHIWHSLARKVDDNVRLQPDMFSLIWVPNGFIIPGGRFRELYYWDTYWIVNGLLLCEMRETAKGVILNLIWLVRQNGFMYNGARKYYQNRSQPPMLTLMVVSYYKATNDFEFVRANIDVLEMEFNFWMANRMVTFEKNGKLYKMARYNVQSRGPRPESYREDYEAAEKFETEDKKNEFYSKIKSGAETGWDFSSRFFITPKGTNRGQLADIETPSIIPVDLNSILHANAEVLSIWYRQIGDEQKANQFKITADKLLLSIQEVMWVEKEGSWFDWDLKNKKNREYFYASNMVPLWTGSYNKEQQKNVAQSVLRYLKNQHIIEEDNTVRYQGTPTSLFVAGTQWDLPNGWSPLQAFIIQGLDKTMDEEAQLVAKNLADVWLRSNFKGYKEKGVMYEKYDVFAAGETGGGGEYNPQTGFGWTNGLVLELLNRYGDSLTYESSPPAEKRLQDHSYLNNINNNIYLGGSCLKKILNSFNLWNL